MGSSAPMIAADRRGPLGTGTLSVRQERRRWKWLTWTASLSDDTEGHSRTGRKDEATTCPGTREAPPARAGPVHLRAQQRFGTVLTAAPGGSTIYAAIPHACCAAKALSREAVSALAPACFQSLLQGTHVGSSGAGGGFALGKGRPARSGAAGRGWNGWKQAGLELLGPREPGTEGNLGVWPEAGGQAWEGSTSKTSSHP